MKFPILYKQLFMGRKLNLKFYYDGCLKVFIKL